MATPTLKRDSSSAPKRPAVGSFRIPNLGDRVFKGICAVAAAWVVFLFLLLAAVLTWQSWPAIIANGVEFFTSSAWKPGGNAAVQTFGSLSFVFGTLVTSAIAMLIAVPLGIGTATYLAE